MTDPILLPTRETRILLDRLTVPGYVVTVHRCFWRRSVFETPHYRIQIARASGITLYADTMPACTSEADAICIGKNYLRIAAAIDRGTQRVRGRAA